MIAAVGGNRVIGRGNTLLWHIPEDLKRFKALTLGHPVVMGRKTFDSIVAFLGKPLPGRSNIVITRDTTWSYPEVVVAHSLSEALNKARELDEEEVFVIGGGQIYAEAIDSADRLYLTLVESTDEGDTFFPQYEDKFTKVLNKEKHEHNGLSYTWIDMERK